MAATGCTAAVSTVSITRLSSSRSSLNGAVSVSMASEKRSGAGAVFKSVGDPCGYRELWYSVSKTKRNKSVRAVVTAENSKVERENSGAPHISRRLALALFAGAAAVTSRVNAAQAAYGEAANIFAGAKKQSGFTPYSGEGFQVDLPSKWNPSKEVEFPGQVLRYEDNGDATSNLSVSIIKAEKSSITDYGSPEELLTSLSYLLGKQSYTGKTTSEGGFADDKVSTASLLESDVKEVNGKTYYSVSVLTRTADGDEGGKHQLIIATIDAGKLYILKVQAGDKRWFKGAKKYVEGAISSFNVI